MRDRETEEPKDFKKMLRDSYRRAYGPSVGGGRPDLEVASFASGLITAGALSGEEAVQALEEGIAAAESDWTPEAKEAALKRLL